MRLNSDKNPLITRMTSSALLDSQFTGPGAHCQHQDGSQTPHGILRTVTYGLCFMVPKLPGSLYGGRKWLRQVKLPDRLTKRALSPTLCGQRASNQLLKSSEQGLETWKFKKAIENP